MNRPVPVVLSAILLGVLAAFQLLAAAGCAGLGFLALSKKIPVAPTPMPYPPSAIPFIFLGTSLVCAALAVWLILTLIGLVRMRSWARYSTLVIAGLMAGFGAILMASSFALPLLMHGLPSAPGQSASDPSVLRGVFFVTGVIYGMIAAVGVAQLVYFNRAKTRELFLLGAPLESGPPNTSTGRRRPTAITVLSWIYMISAVFCLPYIFLPFPTFLCGFILSGTAAHLVYAMFGVLSFLIGYGLYRLRNEARIAVFVLFALCPIQAVVLLTPWGMRQFHTYIAGLGKDIYPGIYGASNPFLGPGPMIFFSIIGLAVYGFVLWLLHRHREAFTAAPPAPPMPVEIAPIAG